MAAPDEVAAEVLAPEAVVAGDVVVEVDVPLVVDIPLMVDVPLVVGVPLGVVELPETNLISASTHFGTNDIPDAHSDC